MGGREGGGREGGGWEGERGEGWREGGREGGGRKGGREGGREEGGREERRKRGEEGGAQTREGDHCGYRTPCVTAYCTWEDRFKTDTQYLLEERLELGKAGLASSRSGVVVLK